MNETKYNHFCERYEHFMRKNVHDNPQDYHFDIREIDGVLLRMKAAIRKGSFNKDSHSFRAVCKELGIKHTYKAINEYLERK